MARIQTTSIAKSDEERRGIFQPLRRQFTRFRRNDEGVAAVEFSIVAIPFLLIIFATMEVGIHYFLNRTMQQGVANVARKLRTGKLPASSLASDFREELCKQVDSGILFLFTCDKFQFDVQRVAAFTAPATPLKPDGTLDTDALDYTPAGSSEINLVRVFYEWPAFLNWAAFDAADPGLNVPNWSGDKRLFTAVAMFQNEPY